MVSAIYTNETILNVKFGINHKKKIATVYFAIIVHGPIGENYFDDMA